MESSWRSHVTLYLGVALVSAGALAFEITLTRLFGIAQGYHFGFLAVSLALLGFGASGSVLEVMPRLAGEPLAPRLAVLGIVFAAGIVAAYLALNNLPFDAYRIAWEPIQFVYLAVYILALTLPFFLAGLVTGAALASRPGQAHRLYAANLAGSGLGCLLPLVALPLLGGEGTVLTTAGLGLVAGLILFQSQVHRYTGTQVHKGKSRRIPCVPVYLYTCVPILVCVAGLAILTALIATRPAWLTLRSSPYKSLSVTLHFPDARRVLSRWDAAARIDVVESDAIRSAPGLSFTYAGPLPRQAGLTVDGDNLSPITAVSTPGALAFLDYLPPAGAYQLAPRHRALVVNPRGGLDVLLALRQGAESVTVIEEQPLAVEILQGPYLAWTGGLYRDPRVAVVTGSARSFVRRPGKPFDLIHLSLSDSFQPVSAGAYSLAENYLYTVEAFQDFYHRLADGGVLMIPRWLQLPPSEEARAGATALAALRGLGIARPEEQIAAFRSFQTLTLLVKRGPFTPTEIDALKAFCARRRFDLVAYPGMAPDEANRYNVLAEPVYFDVFRQLLSSGADRFVAAYPFDIAPATDDRPFFYHLFRWEQIPLILQMFGKTWQPFGGSGYLVLVALLVLVAVASAGLILLPTTFSRSRLNVERSTFNVERPTVVGYFGLLGVAFLFVEIPLMQRFILFLGQPVYSFATVLFGLLVFSGLGSWVAPRLQGRGSLALLAGLVLLYPWVLPWIFSQLIGLSFGLRLVAVMILLAPVGCLMGVPFPAGVAHLGRQAPGLIPWAWAINGCASVLSAVLAAMIGVSFGFTVVLMVGAVAYGVAGVVYPKLAPVRETSNVTLDV